MTSPDRAVNFNLFGFVFVYNRDRHFCRCGGGRDRVAQLLAQQTDSRELEVLVLIAEGRSNQESSGRPKLRAALEEPVSSASTP